MLNEDIQQYNYDTIFIGLTNKPWDLDPAIRNRFYTKIYLPLPDADARYRMLRNLVTAIGDMECRSLSGRLAGFSGADISRLVRHVDMEQIRTLQRASHFKRADLLNSVDTIKPSVTEDNVQKFLAFQQAVGFRDFSVDRYE